MVFDDPYLSIYVGVVNFVLILKRIKNLSAYFLADFAINAHA